MYGTVEQKKVKWWVDEWFKLDKQRQALRQAKSDIHNRYNLDINAQRDYAYQIIEKEIHEIEAKLNLLETTVVYPVDDLFI